MSLLLDELKDAAAKLSGAERAALALALIESLDGATDVEEDVEAAWDREIERRTRQADRGEVSLIPGDEVFARLRRHLG
jgi:putative addiction module component (TIGR02574 family)